MSAMYSEKIIKGRSAPQPCHPAGALLRRLFGGTGRFRLPLLLCLLFPAGASAHGSVTAEADQCLIRVGYLSAHFKIYLPREWGHQDFCEDLPGAGEAVFVMEYIHEDLGRLPVDFRIIRDVTGLGRFARAEDLAEIEDIEAATVFHQSARAVPDVFSVLHEFDEEGAYLGIVTAERADLDQVYTAVFPFEVGFTGFGRWPLFVGLALLIQFNYWFMTGRFPFRGRAARAQRPGAA